ncbi:hypothetical protein HMI55_005139 [Coelomomyces lativittatus]|nr:hypothetical protein HMI55_005139 [Coelomomyces lativittatus]
MGQIKRWRRKLHQWDNPGFANSISGSSVSDRSISDSTSCDSYSSVDSDKAFLEASEWLEQVSDSDTSQFDEHTKSPGPTWANDDIYRFSSLAQYEEEHRNPLS